MATFPQVGLMAVLDVTGFNRGAQIMRDTLGGMSKDLEETEESSAGAGGALDMLGGVATGVATGGLTILLGSVTAVAAGLVGLSTVGLKWATEFGGAMKEVQAQTGATDEEIAKLRETAESVYVAGLGESFEDVAQTMAQVERTTGAAGEELEDMTADALVLSEVFDTDVTESVRAVDQAMIAFGEEGTHVFDLMTRTMQETGDPMDDLADTINEYSTNFAEAGFSADQMFNVLTSGLEAGAWNFDKVGDSVREFFIRLEDGSDTTAEALAGLGLPVDEFLGDLESGAITGADAMSTVIQSLQQIEDPIKRNQLGVALFGSMWEDMGESVILALDPTLDKLGEVEGATQQAGETVHSGLGAAWEELKRTLKVSVAGGFEPVLTMIVEKVTPAFQHFADWLAGPGRAVLDRFGKLLTDNLSPALEKLGPFVEKKVIPALEKFADWMIKEGFPAVQKFINWLIKKGVPGFKKFIDFIIKKVIPALDKLVHPFRPIREEIKETIEKFEQMKEDVETALNRVLSVVEDVLSEVETFFTETLGNILSDAIQWGRDLISEWASFLGDLLSDVIAWGRDLIAEWASFLGDLLSDVIQWGADLIAEWASFLATLLSNIAQWGADLIAEWASFLADLLSDVIAWGQDLIAEWASFLATLLSNIAQWGAELIATWASFLADVLSNVIQWGQDLIAEFASFLSQLLADVVQWGVDLVATFTAAFADVISEVITWGQNMLAEFAAALANIIAEVVAWAVELYNTVRDALLALAAIPAEIMDTLKQIGADIIAFIIEGIQSVTTFVSDLIAQFKIWFSDLLGQIPSIQEIFDVGLGLIQRIIDGIFHKDGADHPLKVAIQGVIEGAAKAIIGAISGIGDLLEAGKQIVGKIVDGIKRQAGEVWEALCGVINDALDRLFGVRPFCGGTKARGAMGGPAGQALNTIGQSISAGMAQGIYDGAHWVAQAAVWTVHQALVAAQHAAGVRSPSALFAGLGADLMAGLQAGMAAQMPAISAQVSAAVTAPALGMVSAPVLSSGATVTNNFHLGGNNIHNDVDGAVFEARVLSVLQRNLSGAGGSLL